jgi:hypothetical protein
MSIVEKIAIIWIEPQEIIFDHKLPGANQIKLTAPTSVGCRGDGDQDRARALADENRPQLNSDTTFNNLIIVNKGVVVNG